MRRTLGFLVGFSLLFGIGIALWWFLVRDRAGGTPNFLSNLTAPGSGTVAAKTVTLESEHPDWSLRKSDAFADLEAYLESQGIGYSPKRENMEVCICSSWLKFPSKSLRS